MNSLLRKRYQLIHKALHDESQTSITLNYETIPIKVGKNGQRFITWNKSTFIIQDPKKGLEYAKLIEQGSKITRIMRSTGSWGLIIDSKIKKP